MNEEVMVTVVCPTYNQGRYLRQGLDSIFVQKVNFKYEVLVGEDCSPDNTNEILKEYLDKYPDVLQVFHREHNLKQSRNVYDLFMRSKGKYIIILDLDDYWTDSEKLQKQVDFLEQNPEYIGTAHDFDLIDAEGKPLFREGRPIKKFLGRAFSLQDFLENGFVYQTGTFCYHNIWRENQDWTILYKSDRTVVDLTVNSLLLLRKNVFIMPESMSIYRDVVSENGLNCRSVCAKDVALDWKTMTEQLEKLNAYFEGKVDYSRMWSNLILNYLKALLRREQGNFSWKECRQMYHNSSTGTKQRIRKELYNSFRRKLRR